MYRNPSFHVGNPNRIGITAEMRGVYASRRMSPRTQKRRRASARSRDEHTALAEIRGFLVVGFLQRQRARHPAPAVEKFPLSVDLDLDAPLTMTSEFAIELVPVLPDCPEVLAGLPLAKLQGSRTSLEVGLARPASVRRAFAPPDAQDCRPHGLP